LDRLINWLEIPVLDMPRAKAFYGALLQVELADYDFPGCEYALFPARSPTNAGALVRGEGYVPSSEGALLYLDATDRLDSLLARAVAAGAEVLMPRTRLSDEAGDVAIFRDSEGNRIGLQSPLPKSVPVPDAEMQRLLAGAPQRFAFVLKPGPAYGDKTNALQWEHARNMFTLLRTGQLRSVTALMDGRDILGIGTLEAASKADVEALLRRDPAVRGERLVFEVYAAGSFQRGEL
jgi:predicted enzyme related to lactoylglutathione lyase